MGVRSGCGNGKRVRVEGREARAAVAICWRSADILVRFGAGEPRADKLTRAASKKQIPIGVLLRSALIFALAVVGAGAVHGGVRLDIIANGKFSVEAVICSGCGQNHRRGWLRYGVDNGKLVPLAELVALDRGRWKDRINQDGGDLLYSSAWSVVSFLVESEKGRAALAAFLRDSRKESDPAKVVERDYPGGLKQLESDWLAYARRVTRPGAVSRLVPAGGRAHNRGDGKQTKACLGPPRSSIPACRPITRRCPRANCAASSSDLQIRSPRVKRLP